MRDRYGVATCYDCKTILDKGAGTRQQRFKRLRMVCKDREGCEERKRERLERREVVLLFARMVS